MAITERAIQLAAMPLRMVQQAAGDDGEAARRTEQGIDRLHTELGDIRAELVSVKEELAQLRSELGGLAEVGGDLDGLRKQIRSLRNKVSAVHEDTQHIRTEQASEVAGNGG